MLRLGVIIFALTIFAQKASLCEFANYSKEALKINSFQTHDAQSDAAQPFCDDVVELPSGEDAPEDAAILPNFNAHISYPSPKLYFIPKDGIPYSPTPSLTIPPNSSRA